MADLSQVMQDAMTFDAEARVKLAELLLDSVNEVDPAIDLLWVEEAKDRVAAYRDETIRALTTEEFFCGITGS